MYFFDFMCQFINFSILFFLFTKFLNGRILSRETLTQLFACRIRRKYNRGLKRKHQALLKRLRKARKAAPELEKPEVGGWKCCGVSLINTFVQW